MPLFALCCKNAAAAVADEANNNTAKAATTRPLTIKKKNSSGSNDSNSSNDSNDSHGNAMVVSSLPGDRMVRELSRQIQPPKQQQQQHHAGYQEVQRRMEEETRNAIAATTIPTSLGNDHDTNNVLDTATQRERNGQCPSCGQQLYKVATNGGGGVKGLWKSLSGSSSNQHGTRRLVPLTIPGRVTRGLCLSCQTSHASTATARTLDSSADDPFESAIQITPPPPPLQVTVTHLSATYHGDTNRQGQRDGVGCMTWSNGDCYNGTFSRNVRCGPGTLTFAAGGEYVGAWRNDLMHGLGTRRYKDGNVYAGQFVEGQRHGSGRFYYANGDLYDGTWQENQMHGPGKYHYASGQRFQGSFVNGQRHGKGKLQRTDGMLEVHRYEHDVKIGHGIRWSVDKTKAWRVAGGKVLGKISVAQAVSMDYELSGPVLTEAV